MQTDRFTAPLANSSFTDIIDALVMLRFAAGAQPFARIAHFKRLPEDADIAPMGGQVTRQNRRATNSTWLVEGDGWTMQLSRDQDGSGWAEACAVSDDLVSEVLACIMKQDDPLPAVLDRVTMGFWHASTHGPRRTARQISAPAWSDIRGNYAAAMVGALDHLVGLDEPRGTGRLVLLHGPPGTGKSTVLRALARAWRRWCHFEYVLDSEVLFKQSGYLLNVLLRADEQATLRDDNDDGDDDDEHRWRLMLLEDCDELIRADAKAETGQGLSRLLNITDGLVGEGLRVLVCITTNETLARLHPAIVRPGRCLANVGFTALSAAEVAAWLGRPMAGGHEATLAELYEARGGASVIAAERWRSSTGLYL